MNIFTSTFSRPDLVQLLADALRATVREDYQFIVHVHAGGLIRPWRNVDSVIHGQRDGYWAFNEIRPFLAHHKSVIMHDDLIPVQGWDSTIFPGPHCTRATATTLFFFDVHHTPKRHMLNALRIHDHSMCPQSWSSFCDLAVTCSVESMMDGVFLHMDKSTIAHPTAPANQNKPALVAAIAAHLNIPAPEPLTEAELAIHKGSKTMGIEQDRDSKRVKAFIVPPTSGPGT